MPDPAERLVNLALFLAAAREPVSAAQVAAQVAGYPPGQAEAAFLRMFERDKEDLLAAGLVLEVVRTGDTERYRLDTDATFAGELTLSPEEAVLLRAAGSALLADPSFPFAEDLRLALAKVSAAVGGPAVEDGAHVPATSLLADEAPGDQAEAVAVLARALAGRKTAAFSYTNVKGEQSARRVEPLGVFARDGRWYLVARDVAADGMRVFAVARISGLTVNAVKPKTPDFPAPEGFDIRDWMALPFQYGPARGEAVLRLTASAADRPGGLTSPHAVQERGADGSLTVRLPVADVAELASWSIANGPGIGVAGPPEARAALAEGLRKVVEAHA